jgi:hypothetical protein
MPAPSKSFAILKSNLFGTSSSFKASQKFRSSWFFFFHYSRSLTFTWHPVKDIIIWHPVKDIIIWHPVKDIIWHPVKDIIWHPVNGIQWCLFVWNLEYLRFPNQSHFFRIIVSPWSFRRVFDIHSSFKCSL